MKEESCPGGVALLCRLYVNSQLMHELRTNTHAWAQEVEKACTATQYSLESVDPNALKHQESQSSIAST